MFASQSFFGWLIQFSIYVRHDLGSPLTRLLSFDEILYYYGEGYTAAGAAKRVVAYFSSKGV